MNEVILRIQGMSCGHCVMAVNKGVPRLFPGGIL